jgi:hypothetical protein
MQQNIMVAVSILDKKHKEIKADIPVYVPM